MATDVIMPQMGESIAEGTIVKWLKKVGDQVQRDEPLFEISTDKVDAEIPAPASGVLAEILAQEGQTVNVNAVVARIGEAGEAKPAAQAQAAAPAQAPAPPPAAAAAPAEPARVTMQREMESPAAVPAPPQPEARITPPGDGQRRGDGQAPAGLPSKEELRRTRSSPLVRNIAREHGINLEEVPGTGLSGRVTKDDILNFIEQRQAGRPQAARTQAAAAVLAPAAPAPAQAPAVPAQAPVAPAAPPVPAPAPVPVYAAGERVKIEPMSVMRRKIAEHMVLSRRTSAHVTTFFEIDFTNIARLRDRVKQSFEERNGVKLTYLPFIIKATIDAIKAFPILNASVDGENIVYKQDINIGLAVALDWGLIVPVVKRADELSMLGLARAAFDLANRARNKQLKPDEVAGGTFTITNPGLYGGLIGTPIINQPQVAIMGVGAIEKRPWVVETADGDAIAIRTIGMLSLSFDHRIIDGAVADQFMAHVKRTLETTDFSTLI
jgi:2-oxoglutarate dehydrogenase E2 component (dihydrolipoamide succinyltransferase)